MFSGRDRAPAAAGRELADAGARRALNNSSEVWLEILLPVGPSSTEEMKRTQQLLASLSMAPEGERLSSELTPDRWTRLQSIVTPTHVPAAVLDRMQPWFASVVVAQGVALGMAGPPIGALTWSSIARPSLRARPSGASRPPKGRCGCSPPCPPTRKLALLRAGLEDGGETGKAKLQAISRDWAAGDDAAAAKHLVTGIKAGSPDLYARMVVARDHAWVPQIEDMLKTPGST